MPEKTPEASDAPGNSETGRISRNKSRPKEYHFIQLTEPESADVIEVLRSATAREIATVVYTEPATPSEIRGHIGTSIQNIHYHLDRLEATGIVERVGTRFSEKNQPMTVFGAPTTPKVLYIGHEAAAPRVESALKEVVSVALAATIASFLVLRSSIVLTLLFGQPQASQQSIAVDLGLAIVAGMVSALAYLVLTRGGRHV